MPPVQLTTFGGRTFDQHFPDPKHHRKRAQYLPIHPRGPLVHGGIQLLLANGVTMRKPGYVKISRTYTVHISMLRRLDWVLPADYFQLCKQSLADVLTNINQPRAGRAVMFKTASTVVVPSSTTTFREVSIGSSIHTRQATLIDIDSLSGQRTASYPESSPRHHGVRTVDHVSSDRVPLLSQQLIRGSHQILPQYTTFMESVTRTNARSHRPPQTILDRFSTIACYTGIVLSSILKSFLLFLRRNHGIIFGLLAAFAVGVGAVFGTIWFINVLHRSLVTAEHWVAGEWQLLLNASSKIYAAVAHFVHAIVQAMMHGFHASVSWLGGTLGSLRHGHGS